MKRCLVIELWGLGDGAMMTAALQRLESAGWQVAVLAKPATRALLAPAYPRVEWIGLDAPWTAFRGKYRLGRWPWGKLLRAVLALRRGRFDAALSARRDPRDHFLMWLSGARRRLGFATRLGRPFLNEAVPPGSPDAHRVEEWWRLTEPLAGAIPAPLPRLVSDPARREALRASWGRNGKPVIALHCGARIAVRRWPEPYFRELIGKLRAEFEFRLVLFPDPDGYGSSLRDLADAVCEGLSLPELAAALSASDLLVANDSGPAHIAAALGLPTITLFGPTKPEWFRPFGPGHHVVIRDLCAYRPCFDYCRFPEPYCLTRLLPAEVWPEIRDRVGAVLGA